MPQPRADCPRGTTYYACRANGFSGCCAVDPCNHSSGCLAALDGDDSSTINSRPVVVSADVGAFTTIKSFTTLRSTATTATASSSSSSSLSATANGSALPLPTTTSTPTTGPPQTTAGGEIPDADSAGLPGGVVAGIVLGSVATLFMLCLCLRFLVRRRRQDRHGNVRRHDHDVSSPTSGILDKAGLQQQQHREKQFSPFGGRSLLDRASRHVRRHRDNPSSNDGWMQTATTQRQEEHESWATASTSPIRWTPGGDPFAEVGGRTDAAERETLPERIVSMLTPGPESAASMAFDAVSPTSPAGAGTKHARTGTSVMELPAEVPGFWLGG